MKKKDSFFSETKKALGFLWQFVKPTVSKIWYTLPLLLIALVVPIVEPYIYKLLINGLIDDPFQINYLGQLLLFWFIISVLGMLLKTFVHIRINHALTTSEYLYDKWRMKKLFSMDMDYFSTLRFGEVIDKTNRPGDAIWQTFGIFRTTGVNWIQSFLIIFFAFYLNWRMTIVLVLMLPFFLLFYTFVLNKISTKQDKILDDWSNVRSGFFNKLQNLILVKIFHKKEKELKRISRKLENVEKRDKEIGTYWGFVKALDGFLVHINHIIIFFGGVLLIHWGYATIGDLVMFLAFSNIIYGSMESLNQDLYEFKKHVRYVRQAQKIFDFQPKIKEVPDAKNLKTTKGKIELKNVSFSYKDKENIKKISFNIESEKTTALVGHSGAGKSTLIKLLNRFYDPQKGTILIDGQNIKEVSLKSLRKNIGAVMQENSVFNDTILNNLRYANESAKLKDIYKATKKANLHKFILSLPKKYNTQVGERGLKLSGGEKQRLAIARIILHNPKIVILDEATSALDSKNEKEVQQALKELMKNRTVIVIAHRLSTVKHADKIIVIDNGKLKEQGTHKQLMRKKGVYRELVDLQTDGFLAK